MKRTRKIIALILTMALLLSTLSGCGAGGGGGKEEKLELSPENTCVTTNDGITVDVGEYVLKEAAELTIQKGKAEENKDEGYKIQPYDFKIGDMHELNDFITIRIPYETNYCEQGQDPAKCVGALYKNESTGEWEDVLFEVDAEKNELVIYTDHLSDYGVYYAVNEGKRNAMITCVFEYDLFMPQTQIIDFSKRLAEDDPTVMEDLAKFGMDVTDKLFDWTDRADNAINMACVGDVPSWLSTDIPGKSLSAFSAIGYTATCVNLMKVAIQETVGDGASKDDILNLIRDVGTKVTTYWADAFTSAGSAALSVGMGGVLVIDKMLTAFAKEAYSTKLEDIAFVYHYFNDTFEGYNHVPKKSADWREIAIQTVDKYPNDPEMAITTLDAAFRKYSSEFFDLTQDEQDFVAGQVENVTVKHFPMIYEKEQEKLIDDYVAYLKDQVLPGVLKSVETYMVNKVRAVQLQEIKKAKEFYNTKINISIKEDLDGESGSQYEGYTVRFAPLNDKAVKEHWTATWPAKGNMSTYSTVLGLEIVGWPHTLEFFAPGVDPDTGTPEFTIPFKITMPEINIEIGAAPTFDELVGTYEDGTRVITEVFISDEFREKLANSSAEEQQSEYGCDLSGLILNLEEQIGQVTENPFEITKSEENTGILKLDDVPGNITYSPNNGNMEFIFEDSYSLKGTLKASYVNGNEAVSVSGPISTSLLFQPSEMLVTFEINGTKPLN